MLTNIILFNLCLCEYVMYLLLVLNDSRSDFKYYLLSFIVFITPIFSYLWKIKQCFLSYEYSIFILIQNLLHFNDNYFPRDGMYSSTGICMFAFGLIIGNSMHKLEYLGVSLYLVGVFLMLTDPFAVKNGAEGNQYMGDLIAFVGVSAGASAGVMLGYYNSKTSKAIHPLVFLTHVILISVFYQIVLLWFLFGPSKVLSTDVGYGAFVWLADSQTFWFLILFADPFNGYLNLVTLFVSYYYWPMQIIASTILIVPFASQIVGIVMSKTTFQDLERYLVCL